MMNFGQNPYRGPHDDYGLSFYFHRGVHVRHRKLYFQTEKGSIADVDHASEGTEAWGLDDDLIFSCRNRRFAPLSRRSSDGAYRFFSQFILEVDFRFGDHRAVLVDHHEFDPGVLLLALAAFTRGGPWLVPGHPHGYAHDGSQRGCSYARDFSRQRTQSPWAILRKHRSVCAAIKPRAEPLSSTVLNQLLDLPLGHRGQVVNIEIAFSAMSHPLITHHLFPVCWAR